MVGRALAFSDAEIVKMAKEDYVAVACDDWYQRRRKDAEGQFFKQVSDQSPRGGDHTDTRQGIYLLTPAGKLLGYSNAGQAPDVMREVLRDALAEWNKLPEDQRRPGAVQVPEPGDLDGGYTRKPPAGGLILNVNARALDKAKKPGAFADAVCKIGGDEASRDHLWLTKAEWKSLVPADPKPGQTFPLPPAIARRIVRFHLIDNTRGEPPFWEAQHVRKSDLKLTVEKASADRALLRLDGESLVSTDADPIKAERGYHARLLGYVGYDAKQQKIDRFDVVAVGDHWGEGAFTGGARPGRKPLGVAFELASGTGPGDTVPPQKAREFDDYFAAAD